MDEISPAPEIGTDIAVVVQQTPVMILTDKHRHDEFFDYIVDEVEKFVPDLSNDKGRKAIASLAYKIARTRTAIDEAGKALNEGARKQIAVIDEARRDVRQRLQALQAQVSRPLDEWKAAEEVRKLKFDIMVKRLTEQAIATLDDTSQSIATRMNDLMGLSFTAAEYGDGVEFLPVQRDLTIAALKPIQARLVREEADRAELTRLRAEADARAEADRLAAEAQAQAEAARAAAERAEAERVQTEAAEVARLERIRAEAERAAAIEADRKAREAIEQAERERRAEQQRKDQEHAEAVAAEKRRADALEAAERRRKAEAEVAAAEDAKRAANEAHRREVMTAAKLAIMREAAVTEEAARAIVLAIVRHQIPQVRISF